MNILLIGAPGSGKGTIAKYLVTKFLLGHISTGDVFRNIINDQDSELGNKIRKCIADGQLVPDDLTNEVAKKAILNVLNDNTKNGCILDGYPRTIDQAIFLEKLTNLDYVLFLDVPNNILLDRIIGRRICPKCNKIYNVNTKFKSKIDNICDLDNSILIQRKDDNIETAKERLSVYLNQTEPLINYYNKKGLLYKIDGARDLDVILEEINSIINSK